MVFDFLANIASGITGNVDLPWTSANETFGTLGQVASALPGLAQGAVDIFSGDKSRVDVPVQTTGFKSLMGLSPELDNFIKNQFINQVIQAGTMERPAIPMRRLTDAEMNTGNIFNNPALIALQQYKDMKAAPVNTPAPAPATATKPVSLPGWDEATQTYSPLGGIPVQGERGKRMAESAYMRGGAEGLLREGMGDNGLTSKGGKLWKTFVGMPMAGIDNRGDTYDNPYTGNIYERSKALEAILSGDLGAFQRQGATASYDPTPGPLDKIGAVAKPFLVASVLGPGAASALGGAGLGGAAANLGSKVFSGGFNRVVA